MFDWVEAPGTFPHSPVRVVVAFHNGTGTKPGDGPGFGGNLSPSMGGNAKTNSNSTIDISIQD